MSSAGFLFDDRPASDPVVTEMAARGADLRGHRSQIVSPELVEQADLVVTMERSHGRDLAAQSGAAKIHTLKSAVERLQLVDSTITDPRERIEALEQHRQRSDFLGQGSDHVVDPYGRSLRANRKMIDEVEPLVSGLLDGLFPASVLTR